MNSSQAASGGKSAVKLRQAQASLHVQLPTHQRLHHHPPGWCSIVIIIRSHLFSVAGRTFQQLLKVKKGAINGSFFNCLLTNFSDYQKVKVGRTAKPKASELDVMAELLMKSR